MHCIRFHRHYVGVSPCSSTAVRVRADIGCLVVLAPAVMEICAPEVRENVPDELRFADAVQSRRCTLTWSRCKTRFDRRTRCLYAL